MRVISKQWTQRTIPVNEDEVLCWVPLPDGARVNNLWLESHVISDRKSDLGGLSYGMSGQIVRKNDPDAPQTYDAEWDLAVTKDLNLATSSSAVHAAIDLDTVNTTVETPEGGPGLIDIEGLFGSDLDGNQEFFNRLKLLTTVNSGRNFNSGDDTIRFTDLVHSRIRFGIKYKVNGMHTAMVGFSNPLMTNTISSIPSTPTEKEWLILSYIDSFIDEMQAYAIGIVPGTTSDPFQDVSAFIADLLAGELLEDTGGRWDSTSFTVYTKASWDISLQDRSKVSVLTA